jgi:hypothetical protein
MKKRNKITLLKLEKTVMSKLSNYDSVMVIGGSSGCNTGTTTVITRQPLVPASQVNQCHTVSITKYEAMAANVFNTVDCTIGECDVASVHC